MNYFICVSSGMVSIDWFPPSLWVVFFCFLKLHGILWLDYFGAYCFWTVLLEKTLESPLDSKEIKPVNPKGNQPWIFTGRPDAEAKTSIFWLPDVKSQFIKKTLMLEKIEGRRRRGWQRTRWLDGITDSMDMNLSKFQEMVKYREVWYAAVHGAAKSWTWLSDWITTN